MAKHILWFGTYIVWFGLVLMLIGAIWMFLSRPQPSQMTVKDGMIHHPKYGTYPKEVPFEQGMTIMPGQSVEIIVEKEKEDKGI